MSWVDAGIVAVLVIMGVMGFRRGLVRQIVELAGLAGGILLGLYLTAGLVEDYGGPLADFRITRPIVFMVIVGLTLLVAQIVGRVAGEIMQVTFFGWFDKLGGAVAGVGKGALWLSILITVVLHLDLGRTFSRRVDESALATPIARLLPAAFQVVKAYAHDAPVREPFDSAVR